MTLATLHDGGSQSHPRGVEPRHNLAMRARDLAETGLFVAPDYPAVEVLSVLTSAGLPGVVVRSGLSFAVIPASQVLRILLP